jgi:hypothetical protein
MKVGTWKNRVSKQSNGQQGEKRKERKRQQSKTNRFRKHWNSIKLPTFRIAVHLFMSPGINVDQYKAEFHAPSLSPTP